MAYKGSLITICIMLVLHQRDFRIPLSMPLTTRGKRFPISSGRCGKIETRPPWAIWSQTFTTGELELLKVT